MPTEAPPFASTRPQVNLRGRGDPRFEEAVLSVTVDMPPDGMDSAEIRLVNWGGSDAGEAGPSFDDVRLGDDLEIVLGGESRQTVFAGQITAIEERYGDGAPHIVFLAEDRLHILARLRASRVLEDVSADDLVGQLAQEAGLSPDANVSTETKTWHQLGESHLAFLRRVLIPYQVGLRVRDGTLVARPHEPAASPFPVDAGDNGLRVRLVADLNRQYGKVTARGLDPVTGEEVSREAETLTGSPSGETAPGTLSDLGWTAEAEVPTPFPTRQVDADVYAQGALDAAGSRFLYGQITCEGEPALSTDGEIELTGVSDRLTGTYAIEHCIHRFDLERGYETQIEVSRPDWQP